VGFLALLAEYFQFEWVVMEVIVFKYGVLVALVVVLALLVIREQVMAVVVVEVLEAQQLELLVEMVLVDM
jgi:hypothetical protein